MDFKPNASELLTERSMAIYIFKRLKYNEKFRKVYKENVKSFEEYQIKEINILEANQKRLWMVNA